jgi:hypothetical protein
MVTKLPDVSGTRIEAHLGFRIVCSCGHVAYRGVRIEADAHATIHRGSHATPMVEVD